MKALSPLSGVLPALLLLCAQPVEAAGGRHALVIGNGSYQHALRLANPLNDATAVADRLQQAGFKVQLAKDTSVRDFLKALERFKQEAEGAEAAVFYYAGHGVEVEGQNYLVPVDATLESKVDLELESVPLGRIIERMDEAKMTLKVVVLDCCRDNPFATRLWLRSRTGSRGGLAAVDERSLAEGTMLVYAGAPGEAVPDGEAAHSPFTAALLQQLQPGRSITTLFSDVAMNVKGSEPWIKIDGSGRSFASFSRYVLIPGEAASTAVTITREPAAQPMVLKEQPFTNSLGMKFVPVRGTKLLFCIHETRKGDYRAYARDQGGGVSGWLLKLVGAAVNDSWENVKIAGKSVSGADDHPVVRVDWHDAKAFCAWLSKKEGRIYRLPTESEWSAAYGIVGQKVTSGSRSGINDGFATTAPVMQFAANEFGLYDLGGNVSEWCEDWYSIDRDMRVSRGGSYPWRDGDGSRQGNVACAHYLTSVGFRVVLER